jgi:hypothetical protein
MDGHDGDLVAVRQMNAFKGGMTIRKRVDGLVSEIVDSYKTNAA